MLGALKCKTYSYIFIEPTSQLLGGTEFKRMWKITWREIAGDVLRVEARVS